jgi:putative proteasome-type protease
VEDGLVLASDSRTSAGVDDLSIYPKMHHFRTLEDRFITLLSAGNLATTQAVIKQLERQIETGGDQPGLNSFEYLDDVARHIGELSSRIQNEFSDQVEQSTRLMEASFILAGQIRGRAHDAFLIYPQGNYIGVSPEKPFIQIGETKYGKPILDRIIEPTISLERAGRCALVSMDASMRSNLTVGPPIELMIYQRDHIDAVRRCRFDADDPYLVALRQAWSEGLNRLFLELPRFGWEPSGSGGAAANQARLRG